MRPAHAVFKLDEHRERLARARAALADEGFDACISVAPETHYYLGGYDAWVGVNSPQALVFSTSRDDDPVLLVRNVDVPLARETTWLGDVRSYHLFSEDFAALVAGIVAEISAGPRRIAIELHSYALSAHLFRQLEAALAPAELADATGILGRLRIVKSPAEMAEIRQAAVYANLGLQAARRTLRPGISEIELAAEIEHAMRAAGSDYWAIPTELSSGPRTPGGHATPRARPIDAGDLVHMEFAGVSNRYHAVAVHTLACGPVSSRHAQVYEAARTSLAAGIAACGPGALVSDIEEASLVPLRSAGLAQHANMRFGYGIGIAYPPIWLESLQISRGFDDRLQPDMVFVLHAYIQLDDEEIGVIQGGTWALQDDGLVQLVGGGDVALDEIVS